MYCRIPGLPSPIPRVQPSPSSSSGSTGSPLLGHPHTSPPTVSPLSSLIARICSRPPWLRLKSTSGEHRLTVPIRPGTGLCVFPQASWDPGWGGGGREQRPTCVQDEAALRLLPPVVWPGGQPGRERPQPQGRGVVFGLGPAAPAGQLRVRQQLCRFLHGAAGREEWSLSVPVPIW